MTEVKKRGLKVKPARVRARGLDNPLRITGPLRSVTYHLPKSVYGVADCRLILLLDDLAEELGKHGVTDVDVNNIYRPGSRLPPKPGRPVRPSQHALALAVDITAFRLGRDRVLSVERDWAGQLGEPVCGPNSRVRGDNPHGVLLRNLTCALARAGFCNHLITPNRDASHFNHLHCDIQADVKEFEVE